MKLLSFKNNKNSSFGLLEDQYIIDLKHYFGPNINSLKEALNILPNNFEFSKLNKMSKLKIDDIEFLPPIIDPGKIICVGVNYESHRLETKRKENLYPTIFTRFFESQVGHLENIIVSKKSYKLDYEGELAVIIGKKGKNLSVQNAMSIVAGYSCYNDATVRDWQKHSSQFTPGKNFDGTGAFGPFLVTKDEIKEINSLVIQTRLNGEIMQKSTIGKLIFSIPELISYCSSFTTLRCGDVIVTGTPGGVGDKRSPQVYLKNGDFVEVEISNIGLLKNYVVDEF